MHSEDKKEKRGGKEETVIKAFYPPSGVQFSPYYNHGNAHFIFIYKRCRTAMNTITSTA